MASRMHWACSLGLGVHGVPERKVASIRPLRAQLCAQCSSRWTETPREGVLSPISVQSVPLTEHLEATNTCDSQSPGSGAQECSRLLLSDSSLGAVIMSARDHCSAGLTGAGRPASKAHCSRAGKMRQGLFLTLGTSPRAAEGPYGGPLASPGVGNPRKREEGAQCL